MDLVYEFETEAIAKAFKEHYTILLLRKRRSIYVVNDGRYKISEFKKIIASWNRRCYDFETGYRHCEDALRFNRN